MSHFLNIGVRYRKLFGNKFDHVIIMTIIMITDYS